MGHRKHPAATIDVEELRIDEWAASPASLDTGWIGKPPAGPPSPPPRHRPKRLGGQGTRVAIVAAVLAVAGIAVTVASGSGEGPDEAAPATTTITSTRPPTTTAPRPVPTAAPTTVVSPGAPTGDELDLRVVVGLPPEGYEVVTAEVYEPDVFGGTAPGLGPAALLFTAPGATWSTGPWLIVTDGRVGPPFPFSRPPTPTEIGGVPASMGPGPSGEEMVVTNGAAGQTVVLAKGLPAGTAATVAAAVASSERVMQLPATALPSGLEPDDSSTLSPWVLGWSDNRTGAVNYSSIDGDHFFSLAVRDAAAHGGYSPGADFFLDDRSYVIVDDAPGVIGTFTAFGSQQRVVVWQAGSHELVLTGDVSADDALRIAGSVVLPGDELWTERRWDDQVDSARRCCTPTEGSTDSVINELSSEVDGSGPWPLWASLADGELVWSVAGDRFGVGARTAMALPLLDVASSGGWRASDFHVAAIALVDASHAGAVLRLTMTATPDGAVEFPVRAPESSGPAFASYLFAAVVAPWTSGGFTVELVAADGTVLAMATDADVP